MTMIFIEIGHILYPKLERFSITENKWVWVFSLTVFIACATANYWYSGESVDLYSSRIGNLLLFTAAAICGTLVLIPISKLLSGNKILLYIGRNSLLYYCLQFLLTIPLTKLSDFICHYLPAYRYVAAFVATAVILIALKPAIDFINKKMPWALGRF